MCVFPVRAFLTSYSAVVGTTMPLLPPLVAAVVFLLPPLSLLLVVVLRLQLVSNALRLIGANQDCHR